MENKHYIDRKFDNYMQESLETINRRLDDVQPSPEKYFRFHKNPKTNEIDAFDIKITKAALRSNDAYTLKLRENAKKENNQTYSTNFSYDLHNNHITTDFLRFDFDPSLTKQGYEPLHANADPVCWGKDHLIFPTDILLNITKLDFIKSINLFQKYVSSSNSHPYDNKANESYLKILEA